MSLSRRFEYKNNLRMELSTKNVKRKASMDMAYGRNSNDSLGICLCKIKFRGIVINIYLIQKDKCKTFDEGNALFPNNSFE